MPVDAGSPAPTWEGFPLFSWFLGSGRRVFVKSQPSAGGGGGCSGEKLCCRTRTGTWRGCGHPGVPLGRKVWCLGRCSDPLCRAFPPGLVEMRSTGQHHGCLGCKNVNFHPEGSPSTQIRAGQELGGVAVAPNLLGWSPGIPMGSLLCVWGHREGPLMSHLWVKGSSVSKKPLCSPSRAGI